MGLEYWYSFPMRGGADERSRTTRRRPALRVSAAEPLRPASDSGDPVGGSAGRPDDRDEALALPVEALSHEAAQSAVQTSVTRKAALRLVSSSVQVDDDWDEPSFAHPALQRPGDRHDCWPIDRDELFRRIAREGERHGLTVDLAVTVAVERGLAIDEIARICNANIEWMVAELNRRASQAERRVALAAAQADYLRRLLGGSRGPAARRELPAMVSLPVRLADRLDRTIVRRALARGEVDVALKWEIAAAAAGQTITEWAAWQTASFIATAMADPA